MTSGIGEMPAQRLGRLIRARRKKLKLTQADVQERGGPSTATLRLIEGGKHTYFRDGTGAALEAALQWAPGSIDTVLSGGEPTSISDEPQLSTTMLAGQLFHPSRRPVTKDMVANDPAVARVLEDLLSRGRVDESDRPIVERALEDARIAGFPAVFESLSRPGKLEVARFGAVVQASEIKQRHMEDDHDDVETAAESDASTQAGQAQVTPSPDEVKLPNAPRAAARRLIDGAGSGKERGVKGDEDPKDTEQIPS